MNRSQLKSSLRKVLSGLGFVVCESVQLRRCADISVLIGLDHGFGSQSFFSVGFWLHSLAQDAPGRLELAHAYFRLERVFPEFRELILKAGDLNDPDQGGAWQELEGLLSTRFVPDLVAAATEEGVRALLSERLKGRGLVRKELKVYLGLDAPRS